MEEITERERFSAEFDMVPKDKKEKPKMKYIPPMTHPWKMQSFMNHIKKTKAP